MGQDRAKDRSTGSLNNTAVLHSLIIRAREGGDGGETKSVGTQELKRSQLTNTMEDELGFRTDWL